MYSLTTNSIIFIIKKCVFIQKMESTEGFIFFYIFLLFIMFIYFIFVYVMALCFKALLTIKLMSAQKYIKDTLTLPGQMPLFNYNLDFKGLRLLIQEIQVRTNSNSDKLQLLNSQLNTKLQQSDFKQLEKTLSSSLVLGLSSTKLADKIYQRDQKSLQSQLNKKELHQLQPIDQYVDKQKKLTWIIQHLVNEVNNIQQKLQNTNNHNQKLISESFRRIDQKMENSLQTMNKNINLYFVENNKKLIDLSTLTDANKRQTDSSIEGLKNSLASKISNDNLKSSIQGIENKIKSQMEQQLSDDVMKRLASLNEYSTKLKEHIKDTDIRIKSMKQNIKEMSEHVSKSMLVKNFEIEKHKIFEKLSQQRTKIDELTRKSGQFVDFRRNTLENNEKVRQSIMGVEDDIKRLRENGSSFKKMEDIGNILQSLDPHLICEIGSEVKLHEKQIGKLEKQVIYLENELQSTKNQKQKAPEINNGQMSDTIIKIIKEYMSNLDFEGRVKRAEKQLHDVSKKSDGVNQLQKKIYMLGKQIDMGAISKQLRKKSDEETTRRDIRIIDSKIEKLFDFYKLLRKDIQELCKKNSRNFKDMGDSVSLTTKKLHPPNCLSCTPKPKSQRHYSRPKFDMSIDESLDHIKNSMYAKY